MTRLLTHLRANAVAYTALFVALGGTSYAAISVANHSLDPVKLNPRFIGGYVRGWASVNANGHVTASAGRPKVQVDSFVGPGQYVITWRGRRPTTSCRSVVSPDFTGGGPVPGYGVSESAAAKRVGEQTVVQTYNATGTPTPLAFDVELVCATPR